MNKVIGNNLKRFRVETKITQTQLGHILGVSFQQIQKYEKGTNKISADKLWIASQYLSVSMEDFFVTE